MENFKSIERKYSKISFNQINEDLKQIMLSKGGPLSDVSPSSYGSVIREMFAAHADMLGFWIESAFNNSWLETAKNPEAGYIAARFLGYSIRRPVPAKCGFIVKLKRTGQYSSVKVVVPKGTVFNIGSNKLTAIDDVEFVYDRNDPDYESGLMKLKSGRAILCEGEFKTVQFFSDGSKFQEFIVLDPTFSNWFGDNDPNYVEPDTMESRINRFTTVTTDASLVDNFEPISGYEEKIYWRIDRRGLVDVYQTKNINDLTSFIKGVNLTNNYSCLITTANDGRVKLEFGDGIISAIPFGIIELKYFSTKGMSGNMVNVSGTKINPTSFDILITQSDGKESDLTIEDITFTLLTDIIGGLDIESLDSIKKNAPIVYSNLDSLGNRQSYIRYLSSISDIRYAIAFGEDILSRYDNGKPNIKYANIVRISLLKDLYKEKDGKFYVTDPSEYYVKGYKVNGLMNLWDYDFSNLPSKTYIDEQDKAISEMKRRMENNNVVILESGNQITVNDFIYKYIPKLTTSYVPNTIFSTGLKPMDYVEVGSELYNILESLNKKGYLTLGDGQHAYVPPIVHDMSMSIDLILKEGMNFTDIKTIVTNKIYSELKKNTKFSAPHYASVYERLIQELPETAGVIIKFSARKNGYETLELDKLTWMSYSTSKFVNQSQLLKNGATNIELNFEYDACIHLESGELSEPTHQTTTIYLGNQNIIQTQIRNYYINKIAFLNKNGIYTIKKNITEKDLTDFTSYIWHIAINELYTKIYDKYIYYGDNGNIDMKIIMYNLLETIKTWYFSEGKLKFIDNQYIKNLSETTGNLYDYIVYIIEYIKLVRNILGYYVASRLIDEDGNITRYSTSYEIVQFKISQSDFKIRFDSDGYKGQ